MANKNKRLANNVGGNFFVDSTCINCDTCRQLATATFAENDDFSSVYRQPVGEAEVHAAYQALIACPVGSIGTLQGDKAQVQKAISSFPLQLAREGARLLERRSWDPLQTKATGTPTSPLRSAPGPEGEGPVSAGPGGEGAIRGCDRHIYYNGFNSEKSFGANSYFLQHPDGNWLIDSPRYVRHLVTAFERMGGIKYIFLTHEDDVADAGRYAAQFGATRIIHSADADAEPGAEWIIEGLDPVEVGQEFRIIPVPGHTQGSIALLYADRYLFTGDHMGWDRDVNGLRLATVYVWNEEILRRSTARLLDYRFEWVLPGHADRICLPAVRMKEELQRLLDRRLSG
jgi:glyoxylase-like metal-dependent hydrolase (beta-lactamase superfamily II)/ferredoxin